MSLDRSSAFDLERPAPDLSLTEVSALIGAGALRPTELVEIMLERIDIHDGALKSYMTVMADSARAEAATAEAELAKGVRRGPLQGVPVAVKDLCMTADAPTSAGMLIHKDFMAQRDATVVERLRRAGAVILGKLTMTEGAFSDHHPGLKTPLNPFGAEFWAGASSSGSGAATAAGLCFGSLGSDTGGSIRFPSAANGVTGLKGTWGRVSRAGVFALADSLDHVGPMARTAKDCAALFQVLAGPDPRDPTALPDPLDDYVAACGAPISGLRIGVDMELVESCDPQVAAALRAAMEVFAALGAEIAPIALPDSRGLHDAWSAICGVEAKIAHLGTWPERKAEYGPVLASVLEGADKVTALELGQAMQRRLTYCGDHAKLMRQVDMILMPVTTFLTPDLDRWARMGAGEDGVEDFGDLLSMTEPADMTGQPALTLPGGFDDRGAPIGIQLIGRSLGEAALLSAGHAFQSLTPFHAARPDLSPFAD